MEKEIEMVKVWHEKFGVPVENVPHIPLHRVELRNNILVEEVKELHEAMKKEDLPETLDALCDILYVVFGTAHETGLAKCLVEAFAEVNRSNMSKLDENGNPIKRDDGKVLKSKLFTPPNLLPIIFDEVIF